MALYKIESNASAHPVAHHHRLALIIFAPLYFAKLIAATISVVVNSPPLPALIAIIFAHGLVPATPTPLFVLAPMIPATCVP
jgi:hypothetical protein